MKPAIIQTVGTVAEAKRASKSKISEGGDRERMAGYAYLAYFFAGALLANAVPHFVHGIAGKRFRTPFASPPGVGESSPLVNVIWGLINFIAGYVLIFGVGNFTIGLNLAALMVGLGVLVTSIGLALVFRRTRSH